MSLRAPTCLGAAISLALENPTQIASADFVNLATTDWESRLQSLFRSVSEESRSSQRRPPFLQARLVDHAIILIIINIPAGDQPHPCGAYAGKRIKEAE